MKTEEEARKTQCCVTGCGELRSQGDERWCVASRCMGWRETEYHNWHAEVQGLLASNAPGAKIDAIKIWRRHSGVGLKEAKIAVERVIDRSLELSAAPRKGYCGRAGKP